MRGVWGGCKRGLGGGGGGGVIKKFICASGGWEEGGLLQTNHIKNNRSIIFIFAQLNYLKKGCWINIYVFQKFKMLDIHFFCSTDHIISST